MPIIGVVPAHRTPHHWTMPTLHGCPCHLDPLAGNQTTRHETCPASYKLSWTLSHAVGLPPTMQLQTTSQDAPPAGLQGWPDTTRMPRRTGVVQPLGAYLCGDNEGPQDPCMSWAHAGAAAWCTCRQAKKSFSGHCEHSPQVFGSKGVCCLERVAAVLNASVFAMVWAMYDINRAAATPGPSADQSVGLQACHTVKYAFINIQDGVGPSLSITSPVLPWLISTGLCDSVISTGDAHSYCPE